mgnify:CR=1 FL=1
MNFTQFNKNGGVEGFCLIKTVDRKMTAKGVPYLDLTLADPDGEINAKLWDYKEELHGEFSANDLIKVRGTVQPFNDSQQLRIERIRKVTEADGVRIEDFVPSAGFSGEAMFDELMKAALSFKDSELKKNGFSPLVIGDANHVGKIAHATKAAYEAAISVK